MWVAVLFNGLTLNGFAADDFSVDGCAMHGMSVLDVVCCCLFCNR
jgi:hypothetical protein